HHLQRSATDEHRHRSVRGPPSTGRRDGCVRGRGKTARHVATGALKVSLRVADSPGGAGRASASPTSMLEFLRVGALPERTDGDGPFTKYPMTIPGQLR